MIKRIGRRFVSLLLTFVTILTMLPAMTLPALAETNGNVPGLTNKNIGLSFTGDEQVQWTANDTKIVGSAKSTDGTCGSTDYKSTLTITNKKSTTATLSFDYAIEQNSGTIQVDGKGVSSEASFTKELATNESVKIYIKSGSTSTATKITMTNVKLIYDTEATVTFLPAEHGSYTVSSTTGSTTITGEWTYTQRSTTAYQVNATPAAGYQFMDWYDVGNKKSISRVPKTELNIEEDCTIKARFTHKDLALFETGGLVYDNLTTAIAATSGKPSPLITQVRDGTISGSYTIPSGVTLLIPFDEGGTLYTTDPKARTDVPKPKSFKTLTMAEGSSITLESGAAISIGGQCRAAGGGFASQVVGPYGHIKMASGSAITVKSGAKLYAWGFISGSGSVTVESGGSVYEWYQVLDFRGGRATLGIKKQVFPFNQYAVQNIEVPLTVHTGASETAYAAIYANSTIYNSSISFIGRDGLFKLTSGSLTKAYDGSTDRISYTVNGTAELNNLTLTLAGQTVNSNEYVLPLTNNMTVNLTQKSKLTVNQTTALLPGVELSIARGAELEVSSGKSMYIYDVDDWGNYCFAHNGKGSEPFAYVLCAPGKTGKRAPLEDVKMDVNGKLTAIGSIYTTEKGANICSSEGTGKYVQEGIPGKGTTTYQYTQQNSDVTLHSIPITPAQLKNLDNSYTSTAGSSAGATFTYCTCTTCGGGKWTNTNDLQVAAINDSTGTQVKTYNTLKGAVDNLKASQYIKLLHNTTEDIKNITKDIYLDLNGRTVTGDISVTGANKLYGMDSSAKVDYTTAPKGKIVGTVKGCAPTYQTPTVKEEYDRYVAIQGKEADGTKNLSFHHFNISVTGYRFELAAPQCALFFIGKFQGDEAAKKYLTYLGFTLKGEDDRPLGEDNYELPADKDIPPEAEPGDSPVVRSGDAFLFEVYLKRSFEKDKPAAYTEKIIATAQAMFKNNETQDSKPKKWSFKDAWTDTDGLKDLTPKQQEILKKFLDELGIKQQTE